MLRGFTVTGGYFHTLGLTPSAAAISLSMTNSRAWPLAILTTISGAAVFRPTRTSSP